VHVHVRLLVIFALEAEDVARLRTTVIAAWIDSCITSPSWPV
jgi:hypothetical protein